ncbi:heparinase II/III family protein, partial [Phytoactinopolyspora endophytica]|uniref:heparinase II/III family protein n=1 Tax=Phytoactinopolyspora endophytica TaxID=1642495 RepID=UPI00101D73F2
MAIPPPPKSGPLLTAWELPATTHALSSSLLPPPRALATPAAGDPAWADCDAATLRHLRSVAEQERGNPWPQPLVSHYARYFNDGNRTAYEDRVGARQQRLTRAVVLAAATADRPRDDRGTPHARSVNGNRHGTDWVDEAADGIALLCEQSSWCWAAHDSSPRLTGTVVPDVRAPYLDLGAGEVAAQLAWADHVLGEVLDERYPGLRARIRLETRQRVLDPFLDRDDWHWLGLDGDVHNWCPWICGNVLVAAVQLLDDEERRGHAVAKAVAGLDRFLASLPDDGSIDEGYEYWWNGAGRALDALDVLAHATSGKLDARQVPVVRETVAFPHRMHLGGPWYLNFADARARPPREQPWHVLHRWARSVGDHDAVRHAAAHREPGQPVGSVEVGLGRLLSALSDPEWTAAEPASPPLVAGVWLPGTEVGVGRETGGSADGLTLAIKGGHNAEHHNHNDVGTVVVAVDGVPVLVDAGRPTYTAQTFGPDRYSIWTMQSSWHNVPEVRGTAQEQGREFHAREMKVTDDDARFQARLDLSAAYPEAGLGRWDRIA